MCVYFAAHARVSLKPNIINCESPRMLNFERLRKLKLELLKFYDTMRVYAKIFSESVTQKCLNCEF